MFIHQPDTRIVMIIIKRRSMHFCLYFSIFSVYWIIANCIRSVKWNKKSFRVKNFYYIIYKILYVPDINIFPLTNTFYTQQRKCFRPNEHEFCNPSDVHIWVSKKFIESFRGSKAKIMVRIFNKAIFSDSSHQ